jgi:hypothetical protein
MTFIGNLVFHNNRRNHSWNVFFPSFQNGSLTKKSIQSIPERGIEYGFINPILYRFTILNEGSSFTTKSMSNPKI